MSDEYKPGQLAEKYLLAIETAQREYPQSGICGLEVEWNLLDAQFRPLLTIGAGPEQQSFVDYLRHEYLSPWLRKFSQLEIFHWMIEWATRPYYSPRGAVYEARLIEAAMLNALAQIGDEFGEQLFAWHGPLPALTQVDLASIPQSWDIAKRRYLERCVTLYGDTLATAGNHSNLSLPEPMLAWDFMHLPDTSRGSMHLDDYKNQVYITGTRLMRAFASLFIATGASTPLQAQVHFGRPVVVLTEFDSVRNLVFPNPPSLDLPDLYRSHPDYLQLSYDLVRRRIRFGNNNWTPVRARSFAEPVERLIAVTSDQLQDVYAHGLYAVGETQPVEEMARQIEIQNLLARINLPMDRVEVRTDDGGAALDVDIANLTLKHLLLLRFYGDESFARNFRYDREDISRARRNEESAARYGLKAEIENPLTGKPTGMRPFLAWLLEELKPLAQALQMWDDLEPLAAMSQGAPNPAEQLRSRLVKELHGSEEVPPAVLADLAEDRQARVSREVELIAERMSLLGGDYARLSEFLQRARDSVRDVPAAPIRFRPRPQAVIELSYPDKTSEIVHLASQLVRFPSVTASPNERLEEVHRAGAFIYDYLRNYGLPVEFMDGKYPAVYCGLQHAGGRGPVLLSGHFDVVEPEPDDSQFEPRVEGDYLWGRGAADMKTVVATYLVWLKDRFRAGPPYPPVALMLIGNEENGEGEPVGTPHALERLAARGLNQPTLLIAGERTEETGSQLWGEICIENRGIMRLNVRAHGVRGHSGVAGAARDLTERLIETRRDIGVLLEDLLTLQAADKWQSQVRFPFIQVGTPGIFNVTADSGLLGIEIRSIPGDRLEQVQERLLAYCQQHELELETAVMENGVACDPGHPDLRLLVQAVEAVSGGKARLGKKLPGTSARFAPGGQGVVWGQSGLGPHSSAERHYLPSIQPYYQALTAFADLLLAGQPAPSGSSEA